MIPSPCAPTASSLDRILDKGGINANQEEGLVLQPSNSEEAVFVCSC